MIKKKVLALDERDASKASTHVVIDWDIYPPNPLKDYDQVFLLHSNDPRKLFCGNESERGYDDPREEIVDEDGYGTGEFRFRDGVVYFPVSAYVHSGIALRLGTFRCAVGDTPIPGGRGRGFDTMPNAAFMWTDKKRFEKMNGPWMMVPDEQFSDNRMRPVKDEAEFRKYLWAIAKVELELFQKYLDCECFQYREETRVPFKRVYPGGREVDDCDWEDVDSCGGFYAGSLGDIDFPKGEDTDVFDATGHFVGDEWTLPELVVKSPVSGLYLMTEGSMDSAAEWVSDLSKAKVFCHWNCAYNAVLMRDKRLWELPAYAQNGGHDAIKDKDELK